jgi:hypothetical protein
MKIDKLRTKKFYNIGHLTSVSVPQIVIKVSVVDKGPVGSKLMSTLIYFFSSSLTLPAVKLMCMSLVSLLKNFHEFSLDLLLIVKKLFSFIADDEAK